MHTCFGCHAGAFRLRYAERPGRHDTGGGDVLVADDLLLARGLTGAPSTFILSGGEAYISGDILEGTAVESGAGTLCAGNIALDAGELTQSGGTVREP